MNLGIKILTTPFFKKYIHNRFSVHIEQVLDTFGNKLIYKPYMF